MPDARAYDGPFEPLPDAIRDLYPDMIGWEFDKRYPEPSRWEPAGWHVITPSGICTHNLAHLCVRDRIVYA